MVLVPACQGKFSQLAKCICSSPPACQGYFSQLTKCICPNSHKIFFPICQENLSQHAAGVCPISPSAFFIFPLNSIQRIFLHTIGCGARLRPAVKTRLLVVHKMCSGIKILPPFYRYYRPMILNVPRDSYVKQQPEFCEVLGKKSAHFHLNRR